MIVNSSNDGPVTLIHDKSGDSKEDEGTKV
jgi:hypothetical protein